MPPDGAAPRPAAERLVALLAVRGRTLAVAESLTGGLLASAVVDVPGASAVFRGGVVAYATDTKASVLGVDERLLDAVGPIDAEVAEQLAEGALRLFGADLGVATTGAAGPDPQDGHPPGEVWIAAVAADGRRATRQLRLAGGRGEIRAGAVEAALQLALDLAAE